MMRCSSLARRLLQIALAVMLLVQAVAFAAVPDVPSAAPAPPCHEAMGAQSPSTSPCCDDPAPCTPNDCALHCLRAASPLLCLPAAAPFVSQADTHLVPRAEIDAVPLRRDIPPLPPPILA